MNRQISCMLLLSIAFVLPVGTAAQETERKLTTLSDALQAAVVVWDGKKIQQLREEFMPLASDADLGFLARYYAAYADYRLSMIAREQAREQAIAHIESAISQLKLALAARERFADGHALLSTLYGHLISFDPLSGASLGYPAEEAMDRARALDPENPRVLMIDAMTRFYAPEMYGGDKRKALRQFQTAAIAFSTYRPAGPAYPRWGGEEVYAWIGQAEQHFGNTDAARRAYEKALEVAPGFTWVSDHLLPTLSQR